MNPRRLVIVIPCFSLDDFPENLEEAIAANFLESWSALWHPRLLGVCKSLPEWKRSDASSLDIENAVILLPQASLGRIDAPLRERIELNDCLLLPTEGDRHQIVEAICQAIAASSLENENEAVGSQAMEGSFTATLPDAVRGDFFALGFAYLQVQMLTRKIRYSSNLNQPLFEEHLQAATGAALANDEPTCQQWLQSCFDQLSQERDHYYSQKAYLLDTCLIARTTLGTKLTSNLASPQPLNVLAAAELLEQLDQANPASLQQVRERQGAATLSVIGGLEQEARLDELSSNAIDAILLAGKRAYESLGLVAPKVFASFMPVLLPDFGMWLRRAGYEGLVLYDWQADRYPKGSQGKITWESADGEGIDAIANYVLDGASSNQLLLLGAKLAVQFDHHQVPTIVLAHWPMATCRAFEDLVRVTKRSPALGEWSTMDSYFTDTQRPYHPQKLPTTSFATPISLTDVARTSQHIRYWQQSLKLDQSKILKDLASQVRTMAAPRTTSVVSSSETAPTTPYLLAEDSNDSSLQRDVNAALCEASDGFSSPNEADRDGLAKFQLGAIEAMQQALPRQKGPGSNAAAGWLICNPNLGSRRVQLEQIPLALSEDEESRIYAANYAQGASDAVIDVPPCGFVRLVANHKPGKKSQPAIANAAGKLANEFLDCQIDPASGRLHSMFIAKRRGNRMSGMMAIRMKNGSTTTETASSGSEYTQMVAKRVELRKSNSVCGRFVVHGSLTYQGANVAQFELHYTLWRGSRVLEVALKRCELEPSMLDRVQYVAWRTAWPNDSAILKAWPHGLAQTIQKKKFRSPTFVEIDEVEHKCYLLTGGVPFHERTGDRFLDSMLFVPQGKFVACRLGMGIDLPRPYQTAMEWLEAAPTAVDLLPPLFSGASAWLFQTSHPHIYLQSTTNLLDSQGACVGIRLLLAETHNEACSFTLSCFRSLKSAERVDSSGRSLGTMKAEGDQVRLSLRANEQALIQLIWS